jgi:5-formyltetrahydrofolate cyclo-ligase
VVNPADDVPRLPQNGPNHDARPAATDVKRWRQAQRERLIQERLAISADERRKHAAQITARLDEVVGQITGRTVSAYCPLRGEPDLRPWMERVIARGGVCALPVVIVRNAPLIFRVWKRGARMERGFWNIPVPADGAEVMPKIVIAPVVGFDPDCYRLGYGGGYFDRTLMAMPAGTRVIGVGYAQAAIPTIHPQPHDIPMNLIVTEKGTLSLSTT